MRKFDALFFDWDGTAVEDRHAPAHDLVGALQPLLSTGPLAAIITGTNIHNILNQEISTLSTQAKHSLYICTNRGSEVYGFNDDGDSELIYRRKATPEEDQALTQAIERLRDYAGQRGLETVITYDRLNRRKLDLIPLPEWADPKKAQFAELFKTVQARLHAAGIKGFKELLDEARKISREAGLNDARITSDLKHIEIGLTDKSDSIRWLFENVVKPKQIPAQNIAIMGDEMGNVGDVQGSDAFMRIPDLEHATYLSVGVEPEGAPPWVNHIGGGPANFLQFLKDQLHAWESAPDPTWILEQEGFDPSQERLMESLFAIGNGYLGIRGSSDFPIPTSQSDLFIAGIYDRKIPGTPYSEIKFLSEPKDAIDDAELVPFPSPFRLKLIIDENPLAAWGPEMIHHVRTLDLRQAVYSQNYRVATPEGKTLQISSKRCASISDPHLLQHEMEIQSETFTGAVAGGLSMNLDDFRLNYPHLAVLKTGSPHWTSPVRLFETLGSKMKCCIATRVSVDGQELDLKVSIDGREMSANEFTCNLSPGQTIRIRHFFSIFTDRDLPSDSPLSLCDTTLKHLNALQWVEFEPKFGNHIERWQAFWKRADLKLPGRPELQQAQRFNLYHLRIAADHDPKISIGGRALTGRAYEGHIFWDTEIFMLPFFIYTEPDIARSLLMYRYFTLNGARNRAKQLGLEGACYAWESTVSGNDVTPRSITIQGTGRSVPILTGQEELHVTADVAYAVWLYWDATLDADFLANYGAEILIETARFWSGRVVQAEGQFHIRGVIGPDEYHIGVNNNAYTNWMARFNLKKALWVLSWLKSTDEERHQALLAKLNFHEKEITRWQTLVNQIVFPNYNRDNVIEQFEGFFNLRDVPLSKEERMKAPISRLFDWEEINRLKIVKQADVLMIPFLFPNAFSKEQLAANYQYYEPITDHGSSLSLGIYAAIAARIGLPVQARGAWEECLNFDLQNTMKNTPLGIHEACIGGTWQAFVFHLLGIQFTDQGPVLGANALENLPPGCTETSLNLVYRGKIYPIRLKSRRKVAA
ncbi:MAG: hypothetical protein P4M08_03165 [Oligoflexia bacterium]|nr:hypothetical protein [Oligoflexia bacterium]